MTTTEYEKYVCTKETLKATLQEYGVAIVPGVLDETECASMVSKVWDFFEHISQTWTTPLNRSNKETWPQFYKLYPLHSMLLQYWGVGHTQASWDVRQNPKVADIFAHLWNCRNADELLVSFDGMSLHLPPETTGRGWNRGNTWFHTDQSFTTPDFRCVQSFVTGLDIEENDATLAVFEGSHKYHQEFRDRFEVSDKSNWYKLTKEQEPFYAERECTPVRIRCPKGSLVLWDSRTIHCGVESNRGRANPKMRVVIYVCYLPRSLCSEANLKKKRKALEEMRATTHNPCAVKLFAKNPRTYGGEVQVVTPLPKPELTELGKKLAGL